MFHYVVLTQSYNISSEGTFVEEGEMFTELLFTRSSYEIAHFFEIPI